MKILGVDPGYARLGWGVIKDEVRIASGCLVTTTDAEEKRLWRLFSGIKQVISSYHPEVVALEKLFWFKNQTTALAVAQSRGAALLAAAQYRLPVVSYTPLQVKQAVSGYGRAEKIQVQQMVKTILRLETIPQPDDAADALAVALTHLFSYKLYTKL